MLTRRLIIGYHRSKPPVTFCNIPREPSASEDTSTMTTLSITDADRAVFAAVASAQEPPGTIVRDFDALLTYLGTDGIPVSPKASQFAIARLPELNARLTHPTPIGLSRGKQMSVSYTHLTLPTSDLV